MEKNYAKKSEVLFVENKKLILKVSASVNSKLDFIPKQRDLEDVKILKRRLLDVFSASLERTETLLFKKKDYILGIDNSNNISIMVDNDKSKLIRMDYYKWILSYYNDLLSTSDYDIERVCEIFINDLTTNISYYMMFSNDVVNTSAFGSYEKCYLFEQIVGKW